MAKRREASHPSLRSLYFNYSYYCLLCTTNTTNTWFCSFIHQYHRQLLAWVDQLVHEGHRWGSSTDDQVVAGEGRHVSAFPRFSFSAFFSATVSFESRLWVLSFYLLFRCGGGSRVRTLTVHSLTVHILHLRIMNIMNSIRHEVQW